MAQLKANHFEVDHESDKNDAEIGIFNGINEEGKMILQTANELKIISSGECSIKGIY